jgi:hypothetical protein
VTAVEQDAARRALLEFIADQLDRRRPIPCRTSPNRDRWTSDNDAEQRAAAEACHDCAAFAGCGMYGDTYPAEHGVYGGKTSTERLPRRGRPRKTTTTKETAA